MKTNKIAIIIFILVQFFSYSVIAQRLPLGVIPKDLKENANAILRLEETTFGIKNIGSAVKKVHKIITILNKKGLEHAKLYIHYDKFTKMKKFKGKIYNAFGQKATKIKKSDLNDYSSFDGFSLFTDNRIKYFSPVFPMYPFTVEYEYEIHYNGVNTIPLWSVSPYRKLSIEEAKFYLVIPKDLKFKYKELNFKANKEIFTNGKIDTHVWTVKNMKAQEREKYTPNIAKNPKLFFCLDKFKYDRHIGTQSSWKAWGKWIHDDLLKERDILPEETKTKIKDLIKNAKNDSEKVKILYNYLQNKTRYVSIQLGIGGWQPFPASVVDKNSYGDCKALSNYMKSLLKVANIKSFYTEIGSGKNQKIIFDDFANVYQTNHIILCVPLQKDTMWLECTSNYYPAGYIGNGNSNRKALLVTPEGGKLVNTPVYSAEKNCQNRTIKAEVLKNGSLNVDLKTLHTGTQAEQELHIASIYSKKEQQEYLYKNINTSNIKIKNFNFDYRKKNLPEVVETMTAELPKYASKTGDRLFLHLNIFNKFNNHLKKKEKRINDIEIDFAFQDVDSIMFNLPENYSIETMVKDSLIENKFGMYSMNFEILDGNKLLYVRKFKMKNGLYPAKDYEELRKFYKQVSYLDNAMIVLKNED